MLLPAPVGVNGILLDIHVLLVNRATIEVGRLADSPGHIMIHNFAEPVILIHNPKPDNN